MLNEVNLRLGGDVVVARRIKRLGDNVDDASPAFRRMMTYLVKVEKRQFSTQGANSGGWLALAASTIEAKRAGGYPEPDRILVRTGAMRAALTQSNDGGGAIRIIEPRRMVFAIDESSDGFEYATFHQEGRGVPKRPPLDLSDYQRKQLVRILRHFLVNDEVLP